ncbi:MAG: lipoate--protein ligase family protein [Acidobacteria bacterium]|jgi:lipoate-protein ligase A|nr:lipoate--protein ligase family protein [Acidobacteriota bacterium]
MSLLLEAFLGVQGAIFSKKAPCSQWRLLKDGIRDPFRHFAVEEALLMGIDTGDTVPTLRLRQVEPSVFIGVYQYPGEDVDVSYCAARGIKIVRRPNPGGAVYQDGGSFCYSLFCPKEFLFKRAAVSNAEQLYPVIGRAVIETCRDFGVRAELSPVNDITIGGRKVYGSAQVEFYGAFVHSGTFLVKTDLEEMERCLKLSQLKFSDKGFRDVKSRVINLCDAAGRDIEISEVMAKLVLHMAEFLQVQFYESGLTKEEIQAVDKLYQEKYSDPAWTFREKDSYGVVVSTKAKSGVITLEAVLEGDMIMDIYIKGDFLVSDQGELDRVMVALKGKRVPDAPGVVNGSRLPVDVREALRELIISIKK